MAQTNQKDWGPHFWLFVGGESEGGGAGLLAVDIPCRGRALAVFSFEEEAQAYLRLAAPRGHWRVEELEAEELASMLLSGACSGFCLVGLDPLPEIWGWEANRLVCMSRERFVSRLLALERRPAIGSARSG